MNMLRGFVIALISLFLCSNISWAESFDLASGIEQYQSGNYEECIKTMKNVVKDDPAMVLGYYYLGLAYTKTGKEILAVDYYNKVINLNSDSTLTMLAREGKSKIKANVSAIEEQLEDIEDDIKDNPIYNDGAKLSPEELRVKYEAPKKQAEGKSTVIKASDFAAAQNQAVQQQNQNSEPTNDDIVNAIKTLQKAGILNNGITPMQAGVMPMPMDSKTQQMNAMLMMMNNNNNNNNGMMNMMPYLNNGGKVDPQMLQMMMMQQMMPNFSSPQNNNGY